MISRITVDLALGYGQVRRSSVELARVAKPTKNANLIDDVLSLLGQSGQIVLRPKYGHTVASCLRGELLASCKDVGHSHPVLGESACLVRTNDRDRAECLYSLQRLAKDLVLAHDIGDDRQGGSQSNR